MFTDPVLLEVLIVRLKSTIQYNLQILNTT